MKRKGGKVLVLPLLLPQLTGSARGCRFPFIIGKGGLTMDTHQIKWNEQVARKIIEQLEKRGMEGSYAASAAQAREEIIAMIPQGVHSLSLRLYDRRIYGSLGRDR